MQTTENRQPTVVRTSRGLSIAGTRITLYTILDYLHAGWPPKLIQDWLNLTASQMADVLAYLASHREEVEVRKRGMVETISTRSVGRFLKSGRFTAASGRVLAQRQAR